MKKLLIMAMAAGLLTGMVSAQDVASVKHAKGLKTAETRTEGPSFKWDKTTHNFGKIPQGTPVTVEFGFTNNGSKPLIITNVGTSCGCTVGDYTKESILPGKRGVVKLTFNAAAEGPFSKSANVSSNVSEEVMILTFNGEVVPAPKQ